MIDIDRLKNDLTNAGCNVHTDMRAPVDFVDQSDEGSVIAAKDYVFDASDTCSLMATKIIKEGSNFAFYKVGTPDEKGRYHLRCAVW